MPAKHGGQPDESRPQKSGPFLGRGAGFEAFAPQIVGFLGNRLNTSSTDPTQMEGCVLP
jgi:hypothetical protein